MNQAERLLTLCKQAILMLIITCNANDDERKEIVEEKCLHYAGYPATAAPAAIIITSFPAHCVSTPDD
jgi:hypothetical protein